MVELRVEIALREIVAARAALDSLEATLVLRARSRGATWPELGVALGLSKQGVRKRHLRIDPVFARRPPGAQTIDDYHAEFAAAMSARGLSIE